jgi:hypothetical protein
VSGKGGSHFRVHTPTLTEHASRTDQRAEQVRGHAQSIGSTSIPGHALGNLGGYTVESANSAHHHAGQVVSDMADHLSSTADTERTTAGRYDEAEEVNTQRFRAIGGGEPATGGGGRGGPPGGRPRGGPAGGEPWEGENGLHLTPEENAAADEFLDRAKRAESQITPVVQGAAHDTNSELLGYPDYVLKSPESFKRKLATALAESPNRNVGDALADMKDSVRYTMRFPSDGYTDGVNTTVRRFGDAGFESVKFKNTWGSPAYQGINSFWKDPSTGHVFEMQFHTQDSFDAKMDTHELYEQARLPGVSEERKQELNNLQNEIFNSVPRPQGASGIRPPDR